ncbi:hypothetical protein CCO03_18725 [Comamonas serinivorans]|uniref:Uncharacterized protein n=1 Tax=Comamonas serinivorans TaxID=1082851 RepID=A0A1Y0ESR4_9BURK|nr:hypothetical protein [Comamonas serinivorans]ARU06421.1 hypothetical protein CCO03_18725 [Comamonas serinivorans]
MAGLAAEQAEAFWQAFRAHELRLAGLAPAAFLQAANALLQPVAPALSIELDAQPAAHAGGRRALRVTAHGNSARFPDLLTLVQHASGLALHAVQAFRSRVPQTRFALQKDGLSLATHQVWLCHHDCDGLVGLHLALPPWPAEQQGLARHMAQAMLGHVLGEWDLAIRVGPIAFVPRLERQRAPCPLSEYAAAFDAFSSGTLGYTQDFPLEDDGPWRFQPLHDVHDRPQQLLVINAGAQRVALRPELGHAVWWSLPVWDEASLVRAHELQHAVALQLQRQRTGVLALATLEQGERRTAQYQASSPREVAQAVARATAQAGLDDADAAALRAAWDPRWQHYREAARLGEQLAQSPDPLFEQLGAV